MLFHVPSTPTPFEYALPLRPYWFVQSLAVTACALVVVEFGDQITLYDARPATLPRRPGTVVGCSVSDASCVEIVPAVPLVPPVVATVPERVNTFDWFGAKNPSLVAVGLIVTVTFVLPEANAVLIPVTELLSPRTTGLTSVAVVVEIFNVNLFN